MRDILARRDVRLLLAGQAISQAGDWLYSVALVIFVFDVTGSPAWVAAAGFVRLVPWIVLSPVGGLIADRLDRRRVLITCDLVQLVAMLALAAVAASGGDPGLALAIALVASLAGVAASPSLQSAWPLLVEERGLAAVNALLSGILNVSMIAGPLVGAVLLLLGSPALAFGLNAITFAASAASYALVRSSMGPERAAASTRATAAQATGSARGAVRSALDDLASGVRSLASSRTSAALVLVASAVLFAYGAQTVLWAVLAADRLGAGTDALTLLYVAYGIGGVVATVPAARAAVERRAGVIVAAAIALGGLSVVALSLASGLAPALLLTGIQGLVVTVADVLVITLLQRALGPLVLGRALGAMDSITSVAMVGGSLLAPVAIAAVGLGTSFAGAGLVLAAVGVAAVLLLREGAAADASLEPRVELLSRLAVFAGAPRFALEGLAAGATEVRAAAGRRVITEGDEPDDLYVLVEGSVAVSKGALDHVIATLRAPEVFGEIGLLKHVPRTATVVAAEPSVLLRIDGPTFLALVRTGVASRATLGRSVGARLAGQHAPHPFEEPHAHGPGEGH